MKKVFGVLLCLVLLTGCATSHLEDGKESVVKFEDGGISAEELYEKLKKVYGGNAIIDLIDTELLSREYKSDSTEEAYIKQNIDSLKDRWGENFDTNILSYGATTEKEFKEYVRLLYRRDKWVNDYAKTQVNDTQINEYYEKEVVGDIEASHILISVDVKSDATDEEKKEAEDKALATAKEVIAKLNKGEKFEDLAKEYSSDESNKNDGGALSKFNDRSNYDENFLDAAIKLEVNKYTTTPVKSQYGYHIIYKTSQGDKPKLDDIKDEIIEKIAPTLISNDSSFTTKAILALRDKYGIKITDDELKSQYNETYGL